MIKYYKNGMMGGTEKDRKEFYDLLDEIKSQALSYKSEYDGDFYDKTTYYLKDGRTAVYTINAEYGIPYSIEVKEIEK